MDIYWKLDGHTPVPCSDLLTWAKAFEFSQRHVALTEFAGGDILVSTVFLGIDHNFCDHGPPLLFETMVFGEQHMTKILGRSRLVRDDLKMRRYSTWDEAEKGHAELVAKFAKYVDVASEQMDFVSEMIKGKPV